MVLDLTRLYYTRQLLHAKTKANDPAEVAESICGVNAQRGVTVYLSFWNRMHNFRKEDLDRALYKKKILVKNWCMRGTLHIIPSSQFYMYMKATNPSYSWSVSDNFKNFCQKILKIFDEPLTKSEIVDRIRDKTDLSEEKLPIWVSSAVRYLGYKGVIVYGKPLGKGIYIRECRFTLAKDWLPNVDLSISEDEARKDLLLNYLSCYGPATVQDFAYWAGIRVREARSIFDSVNVQQVKIEGLKQKYYTRLGDKYNTRYEEDQIVLLPQYDSYIMGHKNKSRIIEENHKSEIFLPLAVVRATIIKNGNIIGTWKMKKNGKTLKFQVTPFKKVDESVQSEIDAEIKKITHVMGVSEYCYG
ncbi:MAG: hypothetical protein AYK18_15070 [Theionarchaea archaeon DG-70]|nr:MAG: hypothetical protein AYK18_15070 [Theionarchaea archaeon DG-70]